jgi:hypothetical protein
MMVEIAFSLKTPQALISHYIEVRGFRGRRLSARHAVTAIQTAMPTCTLSPDELLELLAAAATQKGCEVQLDLNEA